MPSRDPSWTDELPPPMKRRDARIWHLAYVASKRAMEKAKPAPRSIICGTALGALDETCKYLDGVFADGFGSPRHFIASVHNSMAGKLALEFKINGPNLTVCDGQNSFASAAAAVSLLNPDDFPALLVAVDENIELLGRLLPHLSAPCRQYLREGWTEAAVAFILAAPAEKSPPCLTAAGPAPCNGGEPQRCIRERMLATGLDAQAMMPIEATSGSFIQPAITAYELLAQQSRGDHVIGSYSPSSGAAAFVCVCI